MGLFLLPGFGLDPVVEGDHVVIVPEGIEGYALPGLSLLGGLFDFAAGFGLLALLGKGGRAFARGGRFLEVREGLRSLGDGPAFGSPAQTFFATFPVGLESDGEIFISGDAMFPGGVLVEPDAWCVCFDPRDGHGPNLPFENPWQILSPLSPHFLAEMR